MEGKELACGQTIRSQQNQDQLPSCPTPNYVGMIIYLLEPFTWLTAFQVSALNSGVPCQGGFSLDGGPCWGPPSPVLPFLRALLPLFLNDAIIYSTEHRSDIYMKTV